MLIAETTNQRFTDLGKHGPTPGDAQLERIKLLDGAGTAKAGTAYLQCIRNLSQVALCSSTFFLAGRGQITVEGAIPVHEEAVEFDLAVTGGTGDTITLNLIP